MKTSVAMTFAMIAPTKNPSSRLKMTPHESQRCFRLKGLCTIEERPQTGHFNLRLRPRVTIIVRGSRFIRLWIELHLPLGEGWGEGLGALNLTLSPSPK